MNDTIVQSDPTVTITDMRKAIKQTNVVLNMAVTPGVILVLSSMIILKKPMDGYNNILTLARSGMTFGKNGDVNYTKSVAPVPKPVVPITKPKNNNIIQRESNNIIQPECNNIIQLECNNIIKPNNDNIIQPDTKTIVSKELAKNTTEEVVSGVATTLIGSSIAFTSELYLFAFSTVTGTLLLWMLF